MGIRLELFVYLAGAVFRRGERLTLAALMVCLGGWRWDASAGHAPGATQRDHRHRPPAGDGTAAAASPPAHVTRHTTSAYVTDARHRKHDSGGTRHSGCLPSSAHATEELPTSCLRPVQFAFTKLPKFSHTSFCRRGNRHANAYSANVEGRASYLDLLTSRVGQSGR